jgi:integration host factor subunit beta
MTKAELINQIAEKAGITRVKAEIVVNTIFDSMVDALKRNDRIEIRGFGSFVNRHYDAYQGRNPRTGEIIMEKSSTYKIRNFRFSKSEKSSKKP